MSALSLHQRPTDVPTKPDAKTETSASMQGQADNGLVTLAQAAGAGVGAAARAAGPGGPLINTAFGFFVAAAIAAGMWMNARVSQAEDAYRAATERLGAYDTRLIKIEMTLEEYADAAQELPEIRKSLDRLVDDQRKTAGALESLERVLREEKTTP